MTLPLTDLSPGGPRLSPIVAGAWRMVDWQWSPQQRLRWIEQCVELGVTSFDHADIYGGYAVEGQFGEALALAPALREQLQLVGKCGIKLVAPARPAHRIKHYDTSAAHIAASVDASLRSLRTDRLDLLLIHRPDPLMDADAVARSFESLRAAGKVRHFGVSNFTPAQFELLAARFPLVTNQIELHPLQRAPLTDGTLDQLQRLRIRPMIWSPLAGGALLAGGDESARRVQAALSRIGERHGAGAATIAFAWLLRHPSRPLPVAGSRRIEALREAVDALRITLDAQDWTEVWQAASGTKSPEPIAPMLTSAPASEATESLKLQALKVIAGTALAYLLVGLASLQLAIPPSYASPLYPSAGIALAAVLVFGRIAVPGAVLGAFGVNLSLSALRGNLDLSALGVPGLIALGAGLQAWAGATLVQRFARHPQAIDEPGDVAVLFGMGGLLACMTAASIATGSLVASGTVPAAQAPLTWLTWWAGDAFGVLIGAPITLTLIGRPRADWAARRLIVGLTLVLVTLVTALAIAQVARWDDERLRNAFNRDANHAATVLETSCHEPLMALEAMRGVFIASEDVGRDEMRRASAAWLASGRIAAIGWYEAMDRAAVPAFEVRVRAEGLPQFRVFERTDAPAPAAREQVVAMRFVEPMQGNAAALGLNLMSIPASRLAAAMSHRDDVPIASAAFELTQHLPGTDRTGVVVYRAIYASADLGEVQRRPPLAGVLFVTLRPAPLLDSMAGDLPSYLRLCLVDTDARAPIRRLAGPAGCEQQVGAGLTHVRELNFAGRRWELRTSARPADVPEGSGLNAWLFSLVGLLGAAMLGALLLVVSGRARRIEGAVRERTAALEAEVHERERAQAALRDSEQRFRNILNTVPIGVIYTDLRGNVKQTNPRFCELTGYSDDELQTMTSAQYTHPDDVAQDVELSGRLVSGEIPMYRRQKRYITKNGLTLWVQATVTLLRDEFGQARRIVGVVEDIGEHLRLQEAETARERAEAANRAKSEFLSRMSHELRTPLNAMLGFAQLLELDRRQPLSVDQRPWVAQIQQAGWHLLEMINDVLDLSRIESGNLKLQIEPVNLPELLASSLAMVEADVKRRGLRITTELADGTGVLMGDTTRVKQVLVNLLSNAVKYNTDGGRIHIASRPRPHDMVEIAVTDTGLGMTTDQLGELFQPFNRLGRERSSQEGTGIGLVISQRLAELMGGSLRARSIAGEGSSFILALPRAVEPDTVPSNLDPLLTSSAEYHRRIVHYVEDNETNVEVMRGILAQRPQVLMEVSMNGLEGLRAIRAQAPDLVLLDMHLPDLSGLELLARLKADPETAGIPVVVVSADATAQQIDAALQAGASLYLTKPVSVSELLAVVDDLLESRETRFG